MSPQQRINEAAQALVRRLREDNEAAALRGGRSVDEDEYAALEAELRELLARRAVRGIDYEPARC
jgi:hypothetical protein